MSLGLCMIVRDAEQTIAAAIARAKPVISTWTIIDTGSQDNTRDIIQHELKGTPGQLLEQPWVNFAHNRTQLLHAAQGTADYHLMLDADHTLHTHGRQPELTADSYLIRVNGPLEWRLPLLTRDGHPFRYEGAAHAYLTSSAPTRTEPLDWLSIDGGQGATRDKLERDRKALEQAFQDNPSDARTVFYLAQTYRDLDIPHEAIRFYRLRASMGGWAEEVYYARYQLGCLLSEHVSFSQGADELLRAWRDRPTRTEALRALANAANAVAAKTPKPDDVLFVTPSAYKEAA